MSLDAVPALDLPRPRPHVDQAVHDVPLFRPALNVCAAHAVHVASDLLSADAVKYCPPGHVVFLMEHAVTLFVPSLNSVGAHAVHVASAV